jgi:hypothetical protein
MQPLRLLAASLLASASVLPAAAQSHNPLLSPDAPSPTSPLLASPPPSLGPSTPSTLKLTSPNSLQLQASPKDLNALVLHPSNELATLQPQPKQLALLKSDATPLPQATQPCAKLRSYNFTRKDLKTVNPRPSSETDCTPASAGHLKTIPATSADTK